MWELKNFKSPEYTDAFKDGAAFAIVTELCLVLVVIITVTVCCIIWR